MTQNAESAPQTKWERKGCRVSANVSLSNCLQDLGDFIHRGSFRRNLIVKEDTVDHSEGDDDSPPPTEANMYGIGNAPCGMSCRCDRTIPHLPLLSSRLACHVLVAIGLGRVVATQSHKRTSMSASVAQTNGTSSTSLIWLRMAGQIVPNCRHFSFPKLPALRGLTRPLLKRTTFLRLNINRKSSRYDPKEEYMPGKAAKILLSEKQLEILQEIARAATVPVRLGQRATIILLAFQGRRNEDIARQVHLGRRQVGTWRRRWQESWDALIAIECSEPRAALQRAIQDVLSDAPQRLAGKVHRRAGRRHPGAGLRAAREVGPPDRLLDASGTGAGSGPKGPGGLHLRKPGPPLPAGRPAAAPPQQVLAQHDGERRRVVLATGANGLRLLPGRPNPVFPVPHLHGLCR